MAAGLDGDADDAHEIVRGVALQTSDHLSLSVGEDTDEWSTSETSLSALLSSV